jgi:heme o synthase
MSETGLEATLADQANPLSVGGEVRDFVALLKPRVMSLVIFTALVGMVAAPGSIHPLLGAVAILCIAVGAGASGALNMWFDADIDARMARTAARPIPRGSVTPDEALAFGTVLSVISVACLGLFVNWVAAALLAFTIAFYVFIYTIWLKRRTPQNIVIGGAAGAAPPVLGWVAVTNEIHSSALLLFLIIFTWTPPHFWALAIARKDDYAKVGIPMLPVTHGDDFTRLNILLYTILLSAITVVPYLTGMSGLIYLAAALALDAVFLRHVILMRRRPDDHEQAMRTFRFSITYLGFLFAALLVDHYFLFQISI